MRNLLKFIMFLKNYFVKFSQFVGNILSICALFAIYIFAVIPVKFIMFLFKRDRLRLKYQNKNTYWQDENEENNYEVQY